MSSDNRVAKTHIFVLFGGESAEHDVSCVTAAHVVRALNPDRYFVTTIGITRTGDWVLAESPQAMSPQAMSPISAINAGPASVPVSIPDRLTVHGTPTSITPILQSAHENARTVVIPLLHGPMGEDGTVQGVLELAHVAYVGSGVLGSAVAMDKGVAKQILAANNIAQSKFVIVRDTDRRDTSISRAVSELGLPVFVKPANMGSSIGVRKAKSHEEIVTALEHAFEYDEWALIEEAIKGREIEVAVLGNESARASVPGEIIPSHEFYDYEDKYLVDGAKLLIPASLSPDATLEVQQLALKVFSALRSDGMARVDFFYEENGRGFLCNEINTIPGFTPISMYPKLWQASGVSYSELLDQLVELAILRHAKRRRNTAR